MSTESHHATAVMDKPSTPRASQAQVPSMRVRSTRGSQDYSESFRGEGQYLTSAQIRTSGVTIDSQRSVRGGESTHRTAAPVRTVPRPEKSRKSVQRMSRLGSQQVLTQRGRRVSEIKQVSSFARASGWGIALLIVGIAVAMFLSGQSTSQTFRIQQLTYQESQLSNQLETLNRDLEAVRSSADVARRAAHTRMGVPVQPGIVQVNPDGTLNEVRPAQPGQESIIDVNGQAIRPNRASSDPAATNGVSHSLQAVPQGQQHAGNNQ